MHVKEADTFFKNPKMFCRKQRKTWWRRRQASLQQPIMKQGLFSFSLRCHCLLYLPLSFLLIIITESLEPKWFCTSSFCQKFVIMYFTTCIILCLEHNSLHVFFFVLLDAMGVEPKRGTSRLILNGTFFKSWYALKERMNSTYTLYWIYNQWS